MTKRFAWATDIHLDFVSEEGVAAFSREINETDPECLVLCGDIADAPSLVNVLQRLRETLSCPIYFVLGNHDFYHGSVARVRREMTALTRNTEGVAWLPAAGIVPLGPNTCLVGHDGWGDSRLGDYDRSPVMLNDYRYIEELTELDKTSRRACLERLGTEAADFLAGLLPAALVRYSHILLVTHVPPFKDACRHRGEVADDDWLPHFACGAVGDLLRRLMETRPDKEMTVLCGHTHDSSDIAILPNLRVRSGKAEYGRPCLQGVITLDDVGRLCFPDSANL